TTTYFVWNNNFYEQIDGVAMGSPLSPVVANFFMEHFEQKALSSIDPKPRCWFRYVDDVFAVWSHGTEALSVFLDKINNVHPKIQFTLEVEKNGCLPFLDVLVCRKPDGSLGHRVYRKPTHTDRYLHKTSNHHPRQKRGVIKTLVDRANRICEPAHLQDELKHLTAAFQANGYSRQEIKRSTNANRRHKDKEEGALSGFALLPFIKGVTDRIGRILTKNKVKTIFKPTQQIRSALRSAKDTREPLSTAGVYRIPCSCGAVYIGTTMRSVNTRLTEHKRCCRLGQVDKSALAEHALAEGEHRIEFSNTQILSTTLHYYTRMQREAIEIYKHPNNFNRTEEGVKLNKVWFPALRTTSTKPMPTNVVNSVQQTPSVDDDRGSQTVQPDHMERCETLLNEPAFAARASVKKLPLRRSLRIRQQRH
ncbi:hypothetical protein ACNGQH_25240, partial [Escherichia coli]